ncbi:MAG: transporter ATP-binding protein [Polaromonas sp.]|nr:transporter ATP-binding protein [Polaromonas sp.]
MWNYLLCNPVRCHSEFEPRRPKKQLALDHLGKRVGAEQWLYDLTLASRPGEVTVLLGATRAGKTSLMRIMAGLDVPTDGRVHVDGVDVTGVPLCERNVAMVYQQFINYPSLQVADNIAPPRKLRGEKNLGAKVRSLAERLHIKMFLDRYPAVLSGGQRQRVALARALAKGAPLMLLDEPLVNLDYKLREELRDELTQLFAAGDSTVIYATPEPGEALLLGGYGRNWPTRSRRARPSITTRCSRPGKTASNVNAGRLRVLPAPAAVTPSADSCHSGNRKRRNGFDAYRSTRP